RCPALALLELVEPLTCCLSAHSVDRDLHSFLHDALPILLVISGSAFPDSHTNAVARIIESLVEQPEHKVTVIDLCGWDIPVLGQGTTMDLEELKHLAHEADAIMIGTQN